MSNLYLDALRASGARSALTAAFSEARSVRQAEGRSTGVFQSRTGRRPHLGHRFLDMTRSCHSCPHLMHSHQTSRSVKGATSLGVMPLFLVGCQSSARSGNRSANALPRARRVRAPTGPRRAAAHFAQPTPATRALTSRRHSCPHFEHSHHTDRAEPNGTSEGARLPFLVECHSSATFGYAVDNAVSGPRVLPRHSGQWPGLSRLVLCDIRPFLE